MMEESESGEQGGLSRLSAAATTPQNQDTSGCFTGLTALTLVAFGLVLEVI